MPTSQDTEVRQYLVSLSDANFAILTTQTYGVYNVIVATAYITNVPIDNIKNLLL